MGREFELKYRCTAEAFAAIQEAYGEFTSIQMETTYYDTMDGRFGNLHWTLRRRMENNKSVCTLKTPSPDGSRHEWEVECDSIMRAIPLLCQMGAPMELMSLSVSGLGAVCGAEFTRLAKTLEIPGATVELALDKGFLTGGSRKKALLELEVELKDGSDNAAVAFAKQLAAQHHLVPEPRSKYSRALGLARGEEDV